MTSLTTHPRLRREAPRQLRSAALVAVPLSVLLAAMVHAAARAAGSDLVVTPPGQETGPVPVQVALVAAAAGSLVAVVLAAAARRTPRPRTVFLSVSLVGLVLSFASPVAAAHTASTAWWLSLMHVAVAIGCLPPLARVLEDRR